MADLNDLWVLPSEVGIRFDICDESNALYDPEEQMIVMCYELIGDYSSPKWVVWCAPSGATPHQGFQPSRSLQLI